MCDSHEIIYVELKWLIEKNGDHGLCTIVRAISMKDEEIDRLDSSTSGALIFCINTKYPTECVESSILIKIKKQVR